MVKAAKKTAPARKAVRCRVKLMAVAKQPMERPTEAKAQEDSSWWIAMVSSRDKVPLAEITASRAAGSTHLCRAAASPRLGRGCRRLLHQANKSAQPYPA